MEEEKWQDLSREVQSAATDSGVFFNMKYIVI
ncbi:MAG: hypothetical protein ACI9HK_000085 [Pirellulaceae bacterium]|jgi:hypothetical protein